MKKIILMLMLVFTIYGYAQTFPAKYITPTNISWSTKPVPKDIELSHEFVKWLKYSGQDQISQWSYLSLLDENNQQIIIEGSSPSAGGINFLILTKSQVGWRKLIDLQGGFIFYPVPGKRHTLVVYSKVGLEYFRNEFEFHGNKYKKIVSYEVPIELTRLEGASINFYEFFWFMNGKAAQGSK
jgi:hypothetical protein